jgi:hypothetical protein
VSKRLRAGFGAIVWTGLGVTGAAIVFSPLLGFLLSLLLVLIVFGGPWRGGFRWFKAENIVCLEKVRAKCKRQDTNNGTAA